MELGSQVRAVRSNRVLIFDEVSPAVIIIKDGKIQQILSGSVFNQDIVCEVSWRSSVKMSFCVNYPTGFSITACHDCVIAGAGCGGQRGDARHCRLPRSCERAGPHLVGGLLVSHQGRCSGRSDNHCGYALVSWRSHPPTRKINH